MTPLEIQAGTWGLTAGSALLIGVVIAYFADVPHRGMAVVMSFGSGVLISAISFELMGDAYRNGGIDSAIIGFLTGAAVYTVANFYLVYNGARHRKRSGIQQQSDREERGSGIATAVASTLDNLAESAVIGLSMLVGGTVNLVLVIAIFISNIAEGLSSAAGMKNAGRSALYIFAVWGFIFLVTGLVSLGGYTFFQKFSPEVISSAASMAAGAMLAMIADTMLPEAFGEENDFAGLITAVGFLVSFVLSNYMK